MEWKNDILSFSGFDYGVSKRIQIEDESPDKEEVEIQSTSPTLKEYEPTIEQEAIQNDLILSECELDPMSERKIENFYFQNVEQAERKMKMMTQVKSRLSEPRKSGTEITSKMYLKPIYYENPWKNGTIAEKENTQRNAKKNGRCIIS